MIDFFKSGERFRRRSFFSSNQYSTLTSSQQHLNLSFKRGLHCSSFQTFMVVPQERPSPMSTLQDFKIQFQNCIKFLSLTLDSKYSYTLHINSLRSKCLNSLEIHHVFKIVAAENCSVNYTKAWYVSVRTQFDNL